MKKNLSYREKLLELSRIYSISEIQNYIKRKKYLTNSQIEHILKKNKVPIPKEIHISFSEKYFTKPYSKFGKRVLGLRVNMYDLYKNMCLQLEKFFLHTWNNFGNLGLRMLNAIPKIIFSSINLISEKFIKIFYSFYNPKIRIQSANKIVATTGYVVVICAIMILGYTIIENHGAKQKSNLQAKKIEKINKEPKTVLKNKVVKLPSKNTLVIKKNKNNKELLDKKKLAKIPATKKSLKKIKLQEKKPSEVSDIILPNLNLKTETILSLFKDVNYDLKTVRFEKKVKPIYFTQFPKDLDEIQSVKLKKDTFIKIVLPLVVAENEKILDDRYKFNKIKIKKMTSEKEKAWLRLKLREYKVKNGNISELSKRMDIIPVSIALAQAAKESGWGTSRFALEGNAIFGQWTWNGKGIEPLSREVGTNHKILRFPILRASVKAYKNNLNTHKGYKKFREKRYALREKKKSIKGLDLIHTLDSYAQTGKEYTKILAQIIDQNSLFDFESVKLTNSTNKKSLNL